MTSSNVIAINADIDPWNTKPGNSKPVPADIKLVCVYLINVGVDTIDEAVFFRRTGDRDELWVTLPDVNPINATADELRTIALSQGRVVHQVRAGSERKAAARLLKKLIRARAGHGWPCGFVSAGLVDRPLYETLIKDIESGFENNRKATEKGEAPIVGVARDLGLNPNPAPRHPGLWEARCPAGSHHLLLNNKTNDFYCGYCVRHGDADVLTAFRQKPRGDAGKVKRA